MNGIKANARIPVGQQAAPVMRKLKLKFPGQPYDDVLLTTKRRNKHYKANEDRILFKDGSLFRKNYGESGSFKYYQIPVLVLNPAIARTLMAYRQRYYNPYIAQLIKQWVMLCEQCIRESRIDNRLALPPLQYPIEHIIVPEVPFQIDLVPELLPSNDYQNIVTIVSFNFHADFGFSLLFPWFYWLLLSPV